MLDPSSQLSGALVAALVIFAVYRRFRRSFGRQRLSPIRMQLRIAFLVLIGGMVGFSALRSPAMIAATAVGLAAGVALAVWGASQTRFENEAGKAYFVPHTYTGVAVSLLFLGRLIYRLVTLYGGGPPPAADTAQVQPYAQPYAMYVSTPLTVGLLFVLVGYYVCYYSLVLLKSRAGTADSTGPAGAPLGDTSKPV